MSALSTSDFGGILSDIGLSVGRYAKRSPPSLFQWRLILFSLPPEPRMKRGRRNCTANYQPGVDRRTSREHRSLSVCVGNFRKALICRNSYVIFSSRVFDPTLFALNRGPIRKDFATLRLRVNLLLRATSQKHYE